MGRLVQRLARRKRMWAAIAGVLVLAIAGGAWALNRSSSTASAAATSTTTEVAAATSTLRQTVASTGTIEPATQSNLSFAVSGTVTSVPVAVGTKVAKGAVLATVGTTDLQAAVTTAQAELTAANSAVSNSTAASGSAELTSLQAQFTAAQSKLSTAQTALANAKLTSPIAGTVASVSIATGDQVTGSSGSSSGSSSGGSGGSATGGAAAGGTSGTSSAAGSSTSSSAQIVVISTSSWIVNATVGSADLASVKAGLQAEITPTDSTTRVFGTVSSVGIVASSSSGTASFPVVIAVTGSPTGLYAGGSAAVTVIVKQLTNVLTVPTTAVHSVNNQTVVYQRQNGKQVNTPVTVGAVYGASTQITKGLKAGDQVLVTSFGPGRVGNRTPTGGTRTGTGGTGGTGFGGGTGGFGGAPPGDPTGGTGGGAGTGTGGGN